MLPYTTIVYKDQENWYMAKSNTGQILAESGTAPETVIQTALDRKGVFIWNAGDYNSSVSFAGLQIKPDTTIFSSSKTKFNVPNGYTGGALICDPSVSSKITEFIMNGGLTINEQGGSPARNWDGLLIKLNDANGTVFSKFGPMNVWNAKNAVAFDAINVDGWCNACTFDKIVVRLSANGVNVKQTGVTPFSYQLSALKWDDFWYQATSNAEYGFKGLIGDGWTFVNPHVWDMQNSIGGGTGKSAQFLPTAKGFLILGGLMMHYNLDNQAPPGQIRWLDHYSNTSDLQYIERLYQTNGTGFTRVFNIPHGMGFAPDWVDVIPKSNDALTSGITWTHDTTNITVTFMGTVPPPATAANQNNVKFQWRASVK